MLACVRMPARPEPEEVVYPLAPLRAVAIEVWFAPILDAFARLGAFQRRHRQEFSRLHENTGDHTEMRLDGREYERPRTALLIGRDRAVLVARDHVAAIAYAYPE